ncbi:hypothetical protein [Endozoicomonas sp. YOMI1]|uniref:hypothetical protein n=1 Tax=Endozoicomonas sp. YOMI1 TaxID=2828739 RepID=UPI002147ED02|nr:hypothetical protein [Endozoicomonas sp. YOMI1]
MNPSSSSSRLYPVLPQNTPHLPSEGLPARLPSGEKSGIYNTTGGRCFRCSEEDVKRVNLLFCRESKKGQEHIMEASSKNPTVVDPTRGIVNLIPKADDVQSLLGDLGDATLAACKTCVQDGHRLDEHENLTKLSQGLLVNCAEKLASEGSEGSEGSVHECGAVVLLSELPEHYQHAHPQTSPAGELTEPHCADDMPIDDQSSQVWPLPSAPIAREQAGATVMEPGVQDLSAAAIAIKNDIAGMVAATELFKAAVGESIQRQDVQISAQMELQKNAQHRLDRLAEAMPDYVWRIEELERIVKELSVKSDQSKLEINALKEQLRLNANGTFVWKLEDFNKTVNDIGAGGSPASLVSDSFYTAPNKGYKLRAKIFPCGDGSAHGTHVSLFIQVMKGEDDDHVAWPMQKKITVQVLNKEYVPYERCSDVFLTGADSKSFQKPKSEHNIPSGLPRFLPMVDVNDLLHEDGCLYIRIKVEDRLQ